MPRTTAKKTKTSRTTRKGTGETSSAEIKPQVPPPSLRTLKEPQPAPVPETPPEIAQEVQKPAVILSAETPATPVNPAPVPALKKPVRTLSKPVQDPIKIQRLSEQRLLDQKLLRPKTDRLPQFVAISTLLGLIIGTAIIGYSYFYAEPFNVPPPEVIVPEETNEFEVSESSETAPGSEEASKTEETLPAVSVQLAEILDTPTGFLNVREGPGTEFNKIAQVKPGEAYELLKDNSEKGWLEIKLPDGANGWITKQYAKVR